MEGPSKVSVADARARHALPNYPSVQVVVPLGLAHAEEDVPCHRLTVSLDAPEGSLEAPSLPDRRQVLPIEARIGNDLYPIGPLRLVDPYVEGASCSEENGTPREVVHVVGAVRSRAAVVIGPAVRTHAPLLQHGCAFHQDLIRRVVVIRR